LDQNQILHSTLSTTGGSPRQQGHPDRGLPCRSLRYRDSLTRDCLSG